MKILVIICFVHTTHAKEGIQNPFPENPFQIVLTAAHPYNHGHAKTQTADHPDRADHAERTLFAEEFRLIQLPRP